VVPRNKKLPIGLYSSFNHALALLRAFETAVSAFSCHITFFFRLSSRCNNLSFSDSNNFDTGIDVHFAITSAISSSVTFSLRYIFPVFFISAKIVFISSIFFSRAGISPYLILATSPKFHSLS